MIADNYYKVLELLEDTAMAPLDIAASGAIDKKAVHVILHRMKHKGWLTRNDKDYGMTDLGELALEYGRRERE